MNVAEMTDEQLNEILFMRCKEYDDKVRAELMERMSHMSDNPKALLKHFAHLVEVFNNQVWLIHIYREFISAINKEIDAQCNAAKSQGAKLDTGNLTKVMDKFNKQLNEARDLCKRCEPDSFMKMGIFKITKLNEDEPVETPTGNNQSSYEPNTEIPPARDHFHSKKCRTCVHCQLTAVFPRPWVDKPGDPVDYYQDYTPQCLVCRHAKDWVWNKTP